MGNYEEIRERIEVYYMELLLDSMFENEAKEYFISTIEDVLTALVPYATKGNYWWEERNEKM
jgi:hypothetical protein